MLKITPGHERVYGGKGKIAVYMAKHDLAMLKKLANHEGKSISWLISDLINDGFRYRAKK